MRNVLCALVSVALLLGGAAAALAQTPSLSWGSEVNASRCPTDQGYRYLEINVTRKIEQDVAPGLGHFDLVNGGTDGWATREFNQHIQVWKVGASGEDPPRERFCALVRYQGSFVASGSAAPGDDPPGTLAAGVDTFEGGYRLVFDAFEDFIAPTRGHLETVSSSSSATDWMSQYFQFISTRVPESWGWIYHGGHNGTWVNSSGGTAGNITGTP